VRLDRRRLLRVASALVTASPFITEAQQTSAIRVLFDEASPAAADLVRNLGSRFGRVIAVNDVRQLRASLPPRFYVAIGAEAMAAAAEDRLNSPVLALLASRQAYERVVRGRDDSITGIYAERAPSNQMRLIRVVLRRRVTVGVLVSRASLSAIDMLRDAAAAHDLALHAEVYEPQLGLSRNLLRIVDAAAVLAIPDAGVYLAQNLRELLEATYRRRQPVFGFSSAPGCGRHVGLCRVGRRRSCRADRWHVDRHRGAAHATGAIPPLLAGGRERERRALAERPHRCLGPEPGRAAMKRLLHLARWSIAGRLITLALAPTMLMLVIVNGALYWQSQRDADADARDRGELIARSLAEVSRYGVVSGNTSSIEQTVSGIFAADPSVVRVAVLDSGRRPSVVRQLRSPPREVIDFEVGITVEPLNVDTFDSAGRAGAQARAAPLGYVQVTVSPTPIAARRAQRLMIGGTLILLSGLVSLGLGLALARRLHKPLVGILAAIREIMAGRFELRPGREAPGELGELQRAVQAMAHGLQLTQDRLEGEVHARTVELRDAIERLRAADDDKGRVSAVGGRRPGYAAKGL
jgi:putative tryptophan/tyrosine transport system substrate-binding protein